MKKGWKSKKLGELAEIVLGKTPARADLSLWDEKKKTSNVWLSIADLLNAEGNIVSDSNEYISDKGAALCKLVPSGTLLVSFKLTLGRLAFAGRNLFTNEAIAALTIYDETEISREFLYWFLKFFDWKKAAEGDVKIKGMTLNKAKLKEIAILFPPISEQKRIVRILDEAFAGIATAAANAEKNLQHAQDLFESRLESVFAASDNDWVEKCLVEICDVRDGTHDSPKYVETGIPFVTQKNIRPEGLSFEKTNFISRADHDNFYRRSNVARGDVLISMIGANRGMACLVDDDRTFSIKNVGLVKKNDAVNQGFLLFFLKSPQAAAYVRRVSKGGAQEFIGLTEIRKWPVPMPPLQVQCRIVKQLNDVMAETRRLSRMYEQKLSKHEELKRSLLHQAFNGEL